MTFIQSWPLFRDLIDLMNAFIINQVQLYFKLSTYRYNYISDSKANMYYILVMINFLISSFRSQCIYCLSICPSERCSQPTQAARYMYVRVILSIHTLSYKQIISYDCIQKMQELNSKPVFLSRLTGNIIEKRKQT